MTEETSLDDLMETDPFLEELAEIQEKELAKLKEINVANMSRPARRAMGKRNWIPLGGSDIYNTFDLARIQKLMWWLYRNNWLCTNIIDNLTYLTMSGGFSVEWESDADAKAWVVIAEEIKWQFRQRDIMRGVFAYGEWFTLLWPLTDFGMDGGQTKLKTGIRGLDPWYIPKIEGDPTDPELITAYCRTEQVKLNPEDVIHHRVKYIGNYERGLPVCQCIMDPLYWAEKCLGNLHWMFHIRARLPLIMKLDGTSDDVDDEKSRLGTTLPKPGRVWFTNAAVEAVFPDLKMASANAKEVYRLFALAAAQGVGLPEFLVMGSAENSAYASLLAQESPTVQKIVDFQNIFKFDFRRIVKALTGKENFTIAIPPVVQRDIKGLAEAWIMLNQAGICSRETAAGKVGLDWSGPEGEKNKIADEDYGVAGGIPENPAQELEREFVAEALRRRCITDNDLCLELREHLVQTKGENTAEAFSNWVFDGNGR